MTNFAHGRAAEDAAARYLEEQGYTIIDRNWRTKWCEIDIVAQKADIIFFVEVKYRQNSYQGTGLDYITPKKLAQMSRAAESWVQNQNWKGSYELVATALTGPTYVVTDIVSLV